MPLQASPLQVRIITVLRQKNYFTADDTDQNVTDSADQNVADGQVQLVALQLKYEKSEAARLEMQEDFRLLSEMQEKELERRQQQTDDLMKHNGVLMDNRQDLQAQLGASQETNQRLETDLMATKQRLETELNAVRDSRVEDLDRRESIAMGESQADETAKQLF